MGGGKGFNIPVSVGVICFCIFSSCAQVAAVTTAAAIIEDGPVPAVRCMLPYLGGIMLCLTLRSGRTSIMYSCSTE